ncbi:MAG: WD40 repeat domain-containing serine/threonine protein kinase [Vicinamibacteria bacterium]
MSLAPGTRLGPYEIKDPIGAGGMGEVYRARDSRLDRDVAIKVLPEDVWASPKAMERFAREAKAVAALSHPGILSIHDFGQEGRVAYSVTELLEGETLQDRLNEGAISPRKAVDIAVQIANGLASAHEKGVIHRDLKPANLFLTKDGRVKILDFGLATWRPLAEQASDSDVTEAKTKSRDHESEPGVVLGTAGYMSPEQVRGHVVDHRTDIFALGCVMYEMLTGRRAFWRETPAETMTAILREEPPNLSTTERVIPVGLDRLVRRCLEKRPEERLQSARDLAIALDAVSGGESSSAESPVTALRSRGKRTAAAIGAMAVGLMGVAFLIGRRSGAPAPMPAFDSLPTFTKLSFGRGLISAARFGPDGQSVAYSASWDSAPARIYVTRADTPQTSTAPVHEGLLLGISPSNELAILLKPTLGVLSSSGTLARAPSGSGAPREVLAEARDADWSKDGQLAVVRMVDGHARLEFPIGHVLYESSGWLSAPRFSPVGDSIAFIEHPLDGDDRGWPARVDLKTGAKTTLSPPFGTLTGLAWRARGREVCMSSGTSIHCIDVKSGEARRVFRGMSRLILQDIADDDRILATTMALNGASRTGSPGGRESDVGDMAAAMPVDVDPRTGRVLFESIDYGVYLTPIEPGPSVRLGDGIPLGLSPDGASVLILGLDPPTQLSLVPLGAGSARPLPRGTIEQHTSAVFVSDGKTIVIAGSEKDHGSRLFVQDLAGGDPKPISGEGVRLTPFQSRLVSPDNRTVAAIGPDQTLALYPLTGGDPRKIPGLDPTVRAIGWTDHPGTFFVSPNAESRRVPVFRMDVATGRRELWKEIGPEDPIGSPLTMRVQVTPDGRRYAYIYFLSASELFVINGVFGPASGVRP